MQKILHRKHDQISKSNLERNDYKLITRRIGLLTGTSSISSVFDEDDLLVLHLFHSKKPIDDFFKFCNRTDFSEELLLDFMLYDCKQAKFLQVLLKIFKNKVLVKNKYPELELLLDKLVNTLKKCKNSLIYNPQVLINYWESNSKF